MGVMSCICCGTCLIRADDFSTFGTSDITDFAWTPVSGTWDNSFAVMTCAGTGIATCDATQPDGDITMSATVEFSHDTSGQHVDIIVGYVDSTHYYYVRFTVAGASGSIDIRHKNGGSDMSLKLASSVTLNTSFAYTGTACVSPTGVISGSLGGAMWAISAAQTVTGTQAGLGAGTTGTASFYNWNLSKSYETPDAPSCPQCPNQCTHVDGYPVCCICGMNAATPGGCGFTVDSGSATITANSIAITASTTKISSVTEAPAGTVEQRATADVMANNSGDVCRVFIKSANSGTNDYIYAQLTIGGGGSLKVFSVVGGTTTQLGSTFSVSTSASTWYTLTICYGNDRISASESTTGAVVNVASHGGAIFDPAISTHQQAGVSTGAITALVTFKDFSFVFGYASGDHSVCIQCGESTSMGPGCSDDCCARNDSKMIVNIGPGLTNKSGDCSWCGGVEGEYTCANFSGALCTYVRCSAVADCEPGCTDGGIICVDWFPCGADCSPDSTASGPECIGAVVTVTIRVDADNRCWMTVSINVWSSTPDKASAHFPLCPGKILAAATYETTDGATIIPCSGTTYTLSLMSGLACSDTHRGTTGFADPVTFGCNGSWPATITVRSAP